ncbi:prophage MuSo1, transcriptional regulator, Cro/CI family [hydrothermal vent metagenome]|uniref:Prophage MuSo1, transcriptional regulator, Cro/CI family n=1 Tax=hydrothermal vent metagenome TaxID=652676 RepID=A0A1W1CIZ2_9ZZZZ
MINFSEVMQRIKTILYSQIKKDKILDKDIALALQLDPQYYAVMKKRNKIPYEAIAYFSKEYRLNMNWILFAQKPQYLITANVIP